MIKTLHRLLCWHRYYPPYDRAWRRRWMCAKCGHIKVREIR